jgi:hypothetical protein
VSPTSSSAANSGPSASAPIVTDPTASATPSTANGINLIAGS